MVECSRWASHRERATLPIRNAALTMRISTTANRETAAPRPTFSLTSKVVNAFWASK